MRVWAAAEVGGMCLVWAVSWGNRDLVEIRGLLLEISSKSSSQSLGNSSKLSPDAKALSPFLLWLSGPHCWSCIALAGIILMSLGTLG